MKDDDDAREAGTLAEFATADALLAAVRAARAAGYTRIDAYAPFHVEGLAEAVGFRGDRVAPVTFLGGLLGGAGGYFMQWYSAVLDYPLDIGGRPLHSWPMFVPVAFELTILGAALAAFGAVIVGNRLPDLSRRVSDAPRFDLASRDRFFVCLRGDDPVYSPAGAAAVLDRLRPVERVELPR